MKKRDVLLIIAALALVAGLMATGLPGAMLRFWLFDIQFGG